MAGSGARVQQWFCMPSGVTAGGTSLLAMVAGPKECAATCAAVTLCSHYQLLPRGICTLMSNLWGGGGGGTPSSPPSSSPSSSPAAAAASSLRTCVKFAYPAPNPNPNGTSSSSTSFSSPPSVLCLPRGTVSSSLGGSSLGPTLVLGDAKECRIACRLRKANCLASSYSPGSGICSLKGAPMYGPLALLPSGGGDGGNSSITTSTGSNSSGGGGGAIETCLEATLATTTTTITSSSNSSSTSNSTSTSTSSSSSSSNNSSTSASGGGGR